MKVSGVGGGDVDDDTICTISQKLILHCHLNGLYFIFPLIIFYRSITPVFSSFVTINRMTGECKGKKTHSAQSPVETYNGSMCLWKSQHARAILFISRDQSGFVEQVCDCICFLCIPASSLVVDNVFPLFVSLSIIFNAR